MGVALARHAMRRPARMADADACPRPARAASRASSRRACPRRGGARCAPSTSVAMPGRIIAAIFEPPQPVDRAAARPRCRPMMPTMPHISSCRASFAALALAALRRAIRAGAGRASPPAAPRAIASASAGTSPVMTLPAATKAPSPIVTGATSDDVGADEHVRADLGAVLVDAVVIAGDGAGADIGARADACVADIGEVIGLDARRRGASS